MPIKPDISKLYIEDISSSPTIALQCLFYRLVGRFQHFGSDLLLYKESGFSRVIYSILNASVILERNKTRIARNENHLAGNENCFGRNETRIARNKTRGGNLHLSGTVHLYLN